MGGGNGIDLGLAHLQLVAPLAYGGYGMVYRAYDQRLQREVAVKMLDSVADLYSRDRFKLECKLHSSLSDHPGVVTVHSAGYATSGAPFLEMELIEGGTLAEHLLDVGRVSWDEAIRLMVPICDAVRTAHHHGVLHRDLKPANILLSSEGPKLGDFGSACLTASTFPEHTVSWKHAPPEAVTNRRDERSDVYSLASTMYELVTGHAPFAVPAVSSVRELVDRILNEPAPPLPPGLAPDWLADLLRRGLEKAKEQRPQTVGELQATLLEGQLSSRPLLRRATRPGSYLPPKRLLKDAGIFTAVAAAAMASIFIRPDATPEQAEPVALGGAGTEFAFEPSLIDDNIMVTRRWIMSDDGSRLTAEVEIVNWAAEPYEGEHLEVLPVSMAGDPSQIHISSPASATTVTELAPDPTPGGASAVIRYPIHRIEPWQRAVFTYEVALDGTGDPGERLFTLAASQADAQSHFYSRSGSSEPQTITLRLLALHDTDVELDTGQSAALGLFGHLTNGSPAPAAVIDGAAWRSMDPTVATVNADGLVTGVGRGTTTVTAQLGRSTAEARITVDPPDAGRGGGRYGSADSGSGHSDGRDPWGSWDRWGGTEDGSDRWGPGERPDGWDPDRWWDWGDDRSGHQDSDDQADRRDPDDRSWGWP